MPASRILGLISRCQSENKGFEPNKSFKINEKKTGESLLVRDGYCTEAIRKNEDWQFNFAKYYKRKDVNWDDL